MNVSISVKLIMLNFGISPCPNDTFIFFGIIEKKVDLKNLSFNFLIEDVETLNSLCIEKKLHISKISAHAYYYLQNEYDLLMTGGAISEHGPVVVTKNIEKLKQLHTIRIALPGKLTTASALMWFYWKRFFPDKNYQLEFMPFYEVSKKLLSDKADIGVMIHEGRFTYSSIGLKLIADLGEFWKEQTGLPIPLGCIVVEKSLNIKNEVENLIKDSLNFSYSNYDEALLFVKKYAQELDEDVIKAHISYYVNSFTMNMNESGRKAIDELIQRIKKEGIWS